MIELLPLSLVIVYFVPFMIAAARDLDGYVALLVVNALVGWTGIGWVACLVWAVFSPSGAPGARATAAVRTSYLRRVQ
jgi:hypothetical protein